MILEGSSKNSERSSSIQTNKGNSFYSDEGIGGEYLQHGSTVSCPVNLTLKVSFTVQVGAPTYVNCQNTLYHVQGTEREERRKGPVMHREDSDINTATS